MELLFDTNILLDILLRREPFYSESAETLNMVEQGCYEGFIPATSLKDIYYIVRRTTGSREKAYQAIKMVLSVLKPCGISESDVETVMTYHDKSMDFEDNLIEACAVRRSFDYVLTRNGRDYGFLDVKTIAPAELIELFP